MKTKPWAIGLVIASTALTATAQIFYKIAANNMTLSLASITSNLHLFIGLFIYGVAAMMLIIALKYGELSVLYPIISLSFVWVNLLSMRFLAEPLTALKWTGIIFIIAGVSFIGFGNKQTKQVNEVTQIGN